MHDISLVIAIIFNIRIPPTFCEQYMSRDMRFPTMLHFDMNRLLLSFETPNAVRSDLLNSHRAIQATSKCSDHTVCMQAVWIQIRSGALSGLIWLQTVCKGLSAEDTSWQTVNLPIESKSQRYLSKTMVYRHLSQRRERRRNRNEWMNNISRTSCMSNNRNKYINR